MGKLIEGELIDQLKKKYMQLEKESIVAYKPVLFDSSDENLKFVIEDEMPFVPSFRYLRQDGLMLFWREGYIPGHTKTLLEEGKLPPPDYIVANPHYPNHLYSPQEWEWIKSVIRGKVHRGFPDDM